MKTQLNIYMENTTQPQTITIADLDIIKKIIELSAARGAFRAEEMTEIGAMYDKLTGFLQAVIEQTQAQQEAQAASNPAPADQSQGE
jgi:hypothetical protein